ncbi:MAG: zinc ribbon domain-containing protein, partial [Bacteroides xylanisolvens]
MRIIIHNFHHSFHHRGRRGHRGYSGGNIFTHSSDTDCLSVFWKKCRKFFSLPSFPFLPSLSFLSSVSSASSVVKIVMKTVMNLLLCLLLLSSCYYKAPALDSEELSKKTKDSLTYLYERHYTWNTNLEVVDDSISLECLPIKDTFIQLNKGDRVVVAEFAVHPADSVDSVWVKLAHTQDEQGWIREKELKKSFVPTDSISQAIHLFSDTHASYFIIIFALFVGVYLFRAFRRKQLQMVYFNDIDSVYPLFLCLLMAFSATIYESMQVFVPETWEHFYFNPTLSPFKVPFILSVFLLSIWLFLIVALAVLDDLFRQLTPAAAIFYLLGLMSCCI